MVLKFLETRGLSPLPILTPLASTINKFCLNQRHIIVLKTLAIAGLGESRQQNPQITTTPYQQFQ